MTAKERNDYFYVCALIEYIARETLNHRGDIVKAIGEEGIKKLLHDAEMDHCLSFEQVSDEVISYYKIKKGNFDTISNCKYSIPSFLDIGKLYSIMIEDCAKQGEEVQELINIFLLLSVIKFQNLIRIYIIRIRTTLNGHTEMENYWIKTKVS